MLHDFVEQVKEERDDWLTVLDRNNVEYSRLRSEADRLAAIAKYHATNAAFDAADSAVQVFGAAGYKKTERVARHFLDSRATTIYEGANEVLQLKIAAQVLGSQYAAY
jgi:alkylation response protein AidB-like acyl-CoA dehydrogenase